MSLDQTLANVIILCHQLLVITSGQIYTVYLLLFTFAEPNLTLKGYWHYSRRLVVGAAIGFHMTCGAPHGIVLVFRCIVGELLPVFGNSDGQFWKLVILNL